MCSPSLILLFIPARGVVDLLYHFENYCSATHDLLTFDQVSPQPFIPRQTKCHSLSSLTSGSFSAHFTCATLQYVAALDTAVI